MCLLSLVLGVARLPNLTLMLAVPTASTLFRLISGQIRNDHFDFHQGPLSFSFSGDYRPLEFGVLVDGDHLSSRDAGHQGEVFAS